MSARDALSLKADAGRVRLPNAAAVGSGRPVVSGRHTISAMLEFGR